MRTAEERCTFIRSVTQFSRHLNISFIAKSGDITEVSFPLHVTMENKNKQRASWKRKRAIWRHLAASELWSCALFPKVWVRILNLIFEEFLCYFSRISSSVLFESSTEPSVVKGPSVRSSFRDFYSRSVVVWKDGSSSCLFCFFRTSVEFCFVIS